MKNSVIEVLGWSALLGLLLAACGGDDESAGASETVAALTTTTEAFEGTSLVLTWDGENCTYEGPTELSAGLVRLEYTNESDVAGYVNFLRLDEGFTVQDAYDRNPWPTTKRAPAWTSDLGTWGPVPAGKDFSWDRDLSPASYFMVCARIEPVLAVWWGTGLIVEG